MKDKMSNEFYGIKLSEKDRDAFKIMGLELNTDWPNIKKNLKPCKKISP